MIKFWVQPHIRAYPRATYQGRAKCWRQPHPVGPPTGRNPGGRQKEKNTGGCAMVMWGCKMAIQCHKTLMNLHFRIDLTKIVSVYDYSKL